MGHIDLATPVIHAWYQNSTSGGIHHLLGLSGNEIQKILGYVKYITTSEVTDEQREAMFTKLEAKFSDTMNILDTTYVSEKKELEDKKSTKRALQALENKYTDNKAALESEFNRIKSIIASLDRGVTILESDFRTIFAELDDNISFQA